ncbi:MAG TPA: hypothetical protein VKX46_10580 [Ktedonobacteraceae bacterium]|nr:hypothetical protein [Ktedonobacteraceae bacterium]
MATHIQSNSQTELKAYLEERLRAQHPSASSQDIVSAVEIAMGRRGYMLHAEQQHQQNQQRGMNQQQHDNAQRMQQQQNQQQNQQHDNARQNAQGGVQQQAPQALIAVREAAISASQGISDPVVKLASIASAWVAFAATSVANEQHEQNQNQSQQKLGRN